MLSLKLIKEVLKEVKYFPHHAYKVTSGRIKTGVYPHKKFTFGPHKKQYLCWFEPQKITQDQIIIFYHGGGWTFGTPEVFSDRAKLFGALGYPVIMPSHRKLPLYSYQEIREDLILTLKKVYEILKTKGWLHKKIILGGMSSGGNLAGLLLLDHSLLADTGFSQSHFVGALLCGAPVNLEGMTDSFVLANYAGKRTEKSFKEASPMHHLSKELDKPILVVHGTQDGLVNYQGTADFVEKLTPLNKATTDFYTIPNGSHLKAVSWAYEDNEVRNKIISWLTNNFMVTKE